VKILI